MREEVQHYLHRMALAPRTRSGSGSGGEGPRYTRSVGSHPEATLQADDLRLWGRVDLLTVGHAKVDITDYKTGAENESHLDQLRFYAVLWDQDTVTALTEIPQFCSSRFLTLGRSAA